MPKKINLKFNVISVLKIDTKFPAKTRKNFLINIISIEINRNISASETNAIPHAQHETNSRSKTRRCTGVPMFILVAE